MIVEFISAYWMPALWGLLVFFMGILYKALMGYIKEQKQHDLEKKISLAEAEQRDITERQMMKDALIALLKHQLYESCTKSIEEKMITPSRLKALDDLYLPYEALGGNDTGKKLYIQCNKLPIISEDCF